METNGYFSFGQGLGAFDPVTSIVSSPLVAPYWVDNDLRNGGTASYEVHTTGSPVLEQVSSFIQTTEDDDFEGSWMILAEWRDVPLHDFFSSILGTERNPEVTRICTI